MGIRRFNAEEWGLKELPIEEITRKTEALIAELKSAARKR
jgi:hypothetical protein